MLILLDKDISSHSTLWKAILSFFGFGTIYAKFACIKLGQRRPLKMTEIDEDEILSLNIIMTNLNFIVGPILERDLYLNTNKLKTIKTYRAMRMRQGLPSRGQRTHTNAKTARRLKGLWEASFYAKRMAKQSRKKKSYDFFSVIRSC